MLKSALSEDHAGHGLSPAESNRSKHRRDAGFAVEFCDEVCATVRLMKYEDWLFYGEKWPDLVNRSGAEGAGQNMPARRYYWPWDSVVPGSMLFWHRLHMRP